MSRKTMVERRIPLGITMVFEVAVKFLEATFDGILTHMPFSDAIGRVACWLENLSQRETVRVEAIEVSGAQFF